MMHLEHGEVLFKGRGFRTLTQLKVEGGLAFFGTWLLLMGIDGLTGLSSGWRPDAKYSTLYATLLLIGLLLLWCFYQVRFKGRWGHRKLIVVYRSGIQVQDSFVRWDQIRTVYHEAAREPTMLGLYNKPIWPDVIHTVEIETTDNRLFSFRLRRKDFQRFAEALARVLGEEWIQKVRER